MYLYVFKPSDQEIKLRISEQKDLPFTYSPVTGTLGKTSPEDFPPADFSEYYLDHHRVNLGKGQECFDSAVKALREWKPFSLNWVSVHSNETPLRTGEMVGVVAQNLGLWSLNLCRIVYVLEECEEDGSIQRFGFAYGTLPCHVERGEERFLVEWSRDDDTVWFDLLAFSAPAHWLVKMGTPIGRYFQRCFAQEACVRMKRTVAPSSFI